jgi:hypothetical protein
LPHDLGQLTNSRCIELETDLIVADLLASRDVPVIGGDLRMQRLERLQGINHVLGRYPFAVVPSCFGSQSVAYPREVPGIARRLGDETVFAGNLIERRHHERIVDEIDARDQIPFHAGDYHIEAVVSTDHSPAH